MAEQSELIASDIGRYLKEHEHKELLRFITCGSVDDGKSTLIGRLLHDSKMIYEDQLAAITNESKKVGTTGERVDLALLVDGLQSEREQGITIDVAYRYFSTQKRKFIIADTPGHEQYTRNMATGASTADAAIILIDARYGIQTQTRRHSHIVRLLGIRHVILAVNKMDLVGFERERFEAISAEYRAFAATLDITELSMIPISALEGDNVVERSAKSPWYRGKTLLELLEGIPVAGHAAQKPFRFSVQYVIRPHLDFRGFAGTIGSGTLHVGEEICVLPSKQRSRVKSIETYDGTLGQAEAGDAVTLLLEEEIDISRGDMIVHADERVEVAQQIEAELVWMGETPLQSGVSYTLKRATKQTSAVVTQLLFQRDVNTRQQHEATTLKLNEIGRVEVSLGEAMAFDSYESNHHTGSFILIDRMSNATVAAGMIVRAVESADVESAASAFEREFNALVRKHFPHWEAKAVY